MRKIFILLVVLCFVYTGMVSAQTLEQQRSSESNAVEFQKEATDYREGFSQMLVDFTALDPNKDQATEIDYSTAFSFSLPAEETEKLKTDFALNNWKVVPQNSIRFPQIILNTFTKAVEVSGGDYAGQNVLGIRFTFPDYPFDMASVIVPPFMPQMETDAFDGKGVLRNVGIVRSAYITVYGLNQPEKIYVTTEDSVGNEYEYAFGDLKFIGWKKLEWLNENYLEDIRARELQSLPLYPQKTSDLRLKNIKIRRSNIYKTLDLVTYIKDISVTFDKAVDDTLLTDIDNEAVWGLTKRRLGARDAILFNRTIVQRYLEYLDYRKKYDYGAAENAGGGNDNNVAPVAADGQDASPADNAPPAGQ